MLRIIILLAVFISTASPIWANNYHLDINYEIVNITNTPVKKFTVNGGIPAPTLRFAEGENVVISVTNHTNEETSIHWHGFLLPGEMDGAPGFNGFPGIAPGETFTYKFTIRQTGTYWYHAHSMGQEQDGLYGSVVITPKEGERIKSDRDYVILLSDFSEESWKDILANLKMDSSYYNHSQITVGDFIADAKNRGFDPAFENALDWGEMRMSQTDLSDVSGYEFLINGKTSKQNWTGLFKKGERIRLRFINASAMSFYDIRIPGLKMTLVQADGQDVEPVNIDEFRMAVAETYDVIVEPKEEKPYAIVVEPIDRTGFALATLAPSEGMRVEMPEHRRRALLTMADMGMDMGESGWADSDTPKENKALKYEDLRYIGNQKDTRPPTREIEMMLGGSMERYIWTLNGKKHEDSEPIVIKYGERVRIKFVNDTMMAHPMHLHGMFVQLENGQPANKLPNKHTVIIPPGQSRSVLLTADELGEWPFHCHLLYHMLSGMMTKLIVEKN